MTDLNALPLPELYSEFKKTGLITRLLELARAEDLGEDWQHNDVTSLAFVPEWSKGEARIVARAPGLLAGMAAIDDILFLYRADVDLVNALADGSPFQPGQTLGTLKGNLRSIMTAERITLNLLSRLSGVATRAKAFVDAAAIGGTKARVFDTRKTTPGLRVLEKYAVRCGGGCCHRLGLFDAVLIKDNHLASMNAGSHQRPLPESVRDAVRRARREAPREGLRFVMLEVENLDQLRAALDGNAAGQSEEQVNIILLDNMAPDLLRQAVAMRDAAKARVELEASGGITLDNIGTIAATGVDRISTGSMTHGATWVDIALDM